MSRKHDPDRLLTLGEAARILRVRDSDARAWLEEQGLLLRIAGRRRVNRRRLMQALGEPVPRAVEKPARRPRKLLVPVPQTDAF